MSDFYDATVRWPHRDASNVIVTGSFDDWSRSHQLTKTPSGSFQGTVKIPWGEKVPYKYIVDGRWTTTDDQPTEMDSMGNLNNVLRAPARPKSAPLPPVPVAEPEPIPEPQAEVKPEETTTSTTLGAIAAAVETAKQAAATMVEAIAPGTVETPVPTPAVETPAEPELAPKVEPEIAPTPAPEPVIAAEPVSVAPVVPIPIVPLGSPVVEPTTTGSASPDPDNTLLDQPSTHAPVNLNGGAPAEEKPVANGVNGTPVSAPAAEEKPATNGINGTDKSATNDASTPAPAPAPATNGKATTPTKEKKMRFPSLSSRHSRARSSIESGANEHGEKTSPAASPNGKEKKDTVSSRFAGSQRQKRRTSLFGKLKDVFSHPKNEAEA